MKKPRILDLFCGGGGAAEGYIRAGFDVIGVDIAPQPRYPGPVMRADVFWVLDELPGLLEDIDAVHASPPCQGYTAMSNKHRGKGTKADERPRLISDLRAALEGSVDVPWVIENVAGARKHMHGSSILLTGGQFGLKVHRPRLFEPFGFALHAPPRAPSPAGCVGVYGRSPDGRRLWTRKDGTELRCARSAEEGAAAMGITHPMSWREIAESIPPAYTEYVGTALMEHLRKESLPWWPAAARSKR